MNKLQEILNFNKNFVENKEYKKYKATKHPEKEILILSCMDTRLTELLPKALNLKNGDAKIVKNAGAAIMHPFGSVMRSIVVAIYQFNVDEIYVIGHKGCGMCNLSTDTLIQKAIDRGVKKEDIELLSCSGIDIKKWLHGFDSLEESIKDSMKVIKNHPFTIKDIVVHGLIIDTTTGELEVVENGYCI